MITPTGNRLLIEPDTQPETSESGLILIPENRDWVPQAGIVRAYGTGPSQAARVWREAISAVREVLEELASEYPSACLAEALREELYRLASRKCAVSWSVNLGDRVVFPATAGLDVEIDGQRWMLLPEDDVVIVLDEEKEPQAA